MRLRRHAAHLALSLLLLALPACNPGDAHPTATLASPSRVSGVRTESLPAETVALRRRLERAAEGLLYTSESDYPFLWFDAPGHFQAPLRLDDVLAATGASRDEPIEVITLDRFFARHIELVDPADSVARALVPRYRRLRETIRHGVPGVQVFRIGTIQVRCYLVGVDRAGNIVGLATMAIET